MENHHAINGKIHYIWPFSIAMLSYQMVNLHFPMVFLRFFPMRNARKTGPFRPRHNSQELPVGEERKSWGMVSYGWWLGVPEYIYITYKT